MNKTAQHAIVILAAGQGTRMKSNLPKVMHKIGNISMLEHVINLAKKFTETENIIVVSRPDANALNNFLNEKNIKIAWQEQQLGTADAVKSALNQSNFNAQNLLILYADTPLIELETIQKMMFKVLVEKYNLVIGAFESDLPHNYGRLITNNSNVSKIVEFKDCNDEEKSITLANSGIMYGNYDKILNHINSIENNNASKEYYLTDLVEILSNNNLKVGYISENKTQFMGVNDRIQLAEAENIFQERLRKKFMSQGVTLIDPKSVFFSADSLIENDVIIYPNVIIGNEVTIKSGSIILSFSHLSKCIINENVSVGPFATIRDGTTLNQGVSIGNFVEVKKSTLGLKTKARHLSYIGDANIGKNVNIGAGTIFCNYDGFSKYNTNVGDNVFIGSNSSIIAPVNLDDNSIITASTVVTKNVLPNSIVISRAEEKHLLNKAEQFRSKKRKIKDNKQ